MDTTLFNYINGLATHWRILDDVAIFFAAYLQYILGGILLVLLFWPKRQRLHDRIMVVLATGAGLLAGLVVKPLIVFFYVRPRPFLILPQAHLLLSEKTAEYYQAFPSGHTIVFFAISYVVYRFNKPLGWIFFIASGLIGLVRIYAGVHWPSDVLAGAILGILTGWLVCWIYTKYLHPIKNTE